MKGVLIGAGILIAMLIGLGWFHFGPGGDGVLAKLKLKDGSKFMVTQKYNGGGEPYTVSFYMSMPDGTWGWCYIDHEATRWSKVSLNYDETVDTLQVMHGSKLAAVLDRKRKTFTHMTFGTSSELQAPQNIQVPPYDPGTVF